jgi:ATP-dependent Lhr-like helicase
VITAPAGRAARAWSREEAIVELLRGRVSIAGPTDAASLARSLSVSETDAHGALIDLEGQGVVLAVISLPRFRSGPTDRRWNSAIGRCWRASIGTR